MIERAIERGATVHVVSDFVGREVEEVYRLPASRIVRVYAGVAPVVAGDGARGRAIAGTDRYVLALGTIEPRKNLPRLVQAFDQIASRDRDVRLVVAGADGWGIETFDDELARAEHGERIVRTGYVGDEARRDLLAGATVLAYPSLYEGFGHPPLEAMSNGVPVVAAAVGSLPEVLGDAALLVDPFDVEALADALEAACDDAMLRARLSELGPPRAARYTWPRAADEFVALYQRLARERST
jgi:glycosyltransferase involved in cell wall biosynthesis